MVVLTRATNIGKLYMNMAYEWKKRWNDMDPSENNDDGSKVIILKCHFRARY